MHGIRVTDLSPGLHTTMHDRGGQDAFDPDVVVRECRGRAGGRHRAQQRRYSAGPDDVSADGRAETLLVAAGAAGCACPDNELRPKEPASIQASLTTLARRFDLSVEPA
ncbi:hypothetical protein HPB50_025386 [Hyalomma asiaticum]|uniref:Uncharacterized protein n=1 Tax=Hyalomma asiaticum TaxID=266040 RepID=A0ACB7TNH9_HYAAI|nr:hypothetical protein HPB50_025386 [Hyalomma asiaticum]